MKAEDLEKHRVAFMRWNTGHDTMGEMFAALRAESEENDRLRAAITPQRFHDIYEGLALAFGYETREETRRFDPESPNGKLMQAVCDELLRQALEG